jgi:hypothetical protein
MARIAAHDVHDAATPDDLALVANPLDAGSHFHRRTRSTRLVRGPQDKGPNYGKRLSIRQFGRGLQGLLDDFGSPFCPILPAGGFGRWLSPSGSFFPLR